MKTIVGHLGVRERETRQRHEPDWSKAVISQPLIYSGEPPFSSSVEVLILRRDPGLPLTAGGDVRLLLVMQDFLKVLLCLLSHHNRSCNVRLHRNGLTNRCQI